MVRFSTATTASPERRRLFWHCGTGITLALVTFLMYTGSLQMPFVQDDWHVLYAIKTTPAAAFLADAFWPLGKLLYRPLGSAYFLVMFKLFGLVPLAFHIIALVLHTLNAFLVMLIAERLTGRMLVAAATGVLYATASTIHADPLIWMVGFYDLGALFFFFAAFLFYLKGRTAISAAAFLLSLLTKESAAPLTAVFVLHALFLDRQRLRSLWPHLLLFVLYVSVRILGWSFLAPDPAQTYAVEFSPTALLSNIKLLLQWSVEVLFPWWTAGPMLAGVMVIAAALLVLLTVLLGKAEDRRGRLAMGLFLVGWAIAVLIPVVFLRHQLFRYYAACSLVPFFLLVLLCGPMLLSSFSRLAWSLGVTTLVGFMFLNAGTNVVLQHNRFQNESALSIRIFDGSNHLIRKGAIVDMVQREILSRYPSVEPGAILVLDGIPTEPFAGAFGPRLWYNDTTVVVCTTDEYRRLWSNQSGQVRQVLTVTFRDDTLDRRP